MRRRTRGTIKLRSIQWTAFASATWLGSDVHGASASRIERAYARRYVAALMRLFCQLREDLTRRMRETIIPQIRSRDAAANSARRAMHHGRRGYYISVDGMNRRRLDICRGRVNRRTARNEGHLPPPRPLPRELLSRPSYFWALNFNLTIYTLTVT